MCFLPKPQSLEQCKEENYKRLVFPVGFSGLVSLFFFLPGPWFLATGTAWTRLAQTQQEQPKQLGGMLMNDAWTWGAIINSSSWKEKKVGKKLYISHKNLGVNSSQRFQAQNPNQNWAITHIFFFVEPKAVPVRLYICSLINIGDFVFSRKRTGEADSSMWSIWQRVSFMLLVGSSGYICKL